MYQFRPILPRIERMRVAVRDRLIVADAEKDRASINFIDRYIDEQVQEEQTALDILNLFLHRDDHAVALIDDKLATRE